MFWPRCRLTEEESQKVSKYFDPKKARRVKRKIYSGFLFSDAITRQPVFGYQIARRCKVFAMTAAGDLPQFRIQVQTASGEDYFPDYVSATNIFGGYNMLPFSANYIASPPAASVGFPFTACPFVFEPAIVLSANQVLSLKGQPVGPFVATEYQMEVCLHVWEYPGYYGGP